MMLCEKEDMNLAKPHESLHLFTAILTSNSSECPLSRLFRDVHSENFDKTTAILLMEEILHQLIGSLPIIYKVLYIPGGAGFPPSTVWNHQKDSNLDSRELGFQRNASDDFRWQTFTN